MGNAKFEIKSTHTEWLKEMFLYYGYFLIVNRMYSVKHRHYDDDNKEIGKNK